MKFFGVKTMEVKDVNNNAAIQALFTKAAAGNAAGQALGAGFASLISQVGDLVASPDRENGVKNAAKDQSVADKTSAASDLAEDKKARPAKKIRPSTEKEEKTVVRENDRRQPAAEAVPMQGVQNAAPAAAEAAEGTEMLPSADDNGAAPALKPIEGAEPVTREMTVRLADSGEPAVMAVMNGAEMVLMPEAGMDLSSLAQMPVVSVFDSAAGEVVSMTGAEFVAKLQQASDAGQLFIADENSSGKFASLIPAEISADIKSHAGAGTADASLVETGAQIVDEQLFKQAEQLDAKLEHNQKLQLDVEIKEENISLSESADLIQDKLALDEVVNAALKDKVAEGKSAQVHAPVSAQPQSAQSLAGRQQAAQLVNPAAATAANTEIQASAETSKAAAVEGISAVSSNNSALGTAALAGNVRAEARGQSSETSFRDIYKGMSKEVVDQVKVNITKSAVKGVDNIDIQLKPEDLGHIQIKMQISKDGKLQAHIVSSRPETMEILQKEAQNLEKAFNDAGFQTDEGSLSFSFREGGESGREQDRNSELRSFIGNVLEHDVENELAGNDNLPDWTPAQGLNIRV